MSEFADEYDCGFEAARNGLLTDLEKKAMKQTSKLWRSISAIVDTGDGREQDMRELIKPIHDIQRAIMAQAACRAYPGEYRLLGAGRLEKSGTYGKQEKLSLAEVSRMYKDAVAAFDKHKRRDKQHRAGFKMLQWKCTNDICRTQTFESVGCVSLTCLWRHSFTNCPECDEDSTTLGGTGTNTDVVGPKTDLPRHERPPTTPSVKVTDDSRIHIAAYSTDKKEWWCYQPDCSVSTYQSLRCGCRDRQHALHVCPGCNLRSNMMKTGGR